MELANKIQSKAALLLPIPSLAPEFATVEFRNARRQVLINRKTFPPDCVLTVSNYGDLTNQQVLEQNDEVIDKDWAREREFTTEDEDTASLGLRVLANCYYFLLSLTSSFVFMYVKLGFISHPLREWAVELLKKCFPYRITKHQMKELAHSETFDGKFLLLLFWNCID